MRWAGPVAVFLAAALVALRAPAWSPAGWVPELPLLTVLYIAARGTPQRAAAWGGLLGLALCPWTAEPPLLQSVALGAAGWFGAKAVGVVDRRNALAVAAVTLAASLFLRGVEAAAAGGAGAPIAVALTCAVSTAAASLPFHAFLSATGAMQPVERSFRDV